MRAAGADAEAMRRALLEGCLRTLTDPGARKSLAIQTAAAALGGSGQAVRRGVEPTAEQVERVVGEITEALGSRYVEAKHPRDRQGRWRDVPGRGDDAPKRVKSVSGIGGTPSRSSQASAGPGDGARRAKSTSGIGGASTSDGAGGARQPQAKPTASKPRSSGDGKSKSVSGIGGSRAKAGGTWDQDAWAADALVVDANGDIEVAAKALAAGKRVRLNQPREVATLLDKLNEMVRDAAAKGEKAPTYDLCKVSVPGTNLFCLESKNIPRVQMPQLKGVPTPGSKASKVKPDKRGEVDLQDEFRKWLEDSGVKITDETEKAAYCRATQNELNGAKVAGIERAFQEGKLDYARLFVSKDNYIVDGHHRWAAQVANDLRDNVPGDITMDVARVDMDIGELLAAANQFAADWGIPQVGLNQGFASEKKVRESADDCGCGGPVLQEAPAAVNDTRQVLADKPKRPARPVSKPAPKPAGRGNTRASGGDDQAREPRAAQDDFEKLHPRGRGGLWIKKNQGVNSPTGDPQVAQAQRRLAQLGYAPGAPDGKAGPLTQAAISKFQAAYGLRQTGEIDPATYQTMLSPPARTVEQVRRDQEKLDAVPDARGNTREGSARGDASGGDPTTTKKVTRNPDGSVTTTTTTTAGGDGEGDDGRAPRRGQSGGKGGASKGGASKGGSREGKGKQATTGGVIGEGEGVDGEPSAQVKALQQDLQTLGYDLGKFGVDGRFGPYTDRAIRRLQREHGLKADGKVGRRTRRLLKRLVQRQGEIAKAKGRVQSADEMQEGAVAWKGWLHPRDREGRFREVSRGLTSAAKAEWGAAIKATPRRADVGDSVAFKANPLLQTLEGAGVGRVQAVRDAPGGGTIYVVDTVKGVKRVHDDQVVSVRKRKVREDLVERFDDATARRLVAEAALAEGRASGAFVGAHAEEMALARVVLREAVGDLDVTQARAAAMLGQRTTEARGVLAEAGCKMPHKAMAKREMRTCPSCGVKLDRLAKDIEESTQSPLALLESVDIGAEGHREVIAFMRTGGWRLVEARARKLDALPPLGPVDLSEVKSSVYPGLERKKGGPDNWVEKAGGLPKYIERIAKHLHYEKGKTISHAIAIAVNVVKKMCASGDTNWPGKQNVNPKSRAEACRAVASWERKKASTKGRD